MRVPQLEAGGAPPDEQAEVDQPRLSVDGRSVLVNRIQAKLGQMSRKQQRLAQHFVDNPAKVAFGTANDIGDDAGASAATVVRFAQFLGYDGFSELRESLQAGLLPFPTFEEQLSNLADMDIGSPAQLADIVFGYERENLAATQAMLDPDVCRRVAEAIATAGRTILIGEGVGGAVVQLLANQFTRLGLPLLVPHDSVHAVIALANARADDLVLGVTFWRFARSTNDLLMTAKSRGATTAAIVDSPLFPAADHVDHLLTIRSRNAGQGPSAAAAIAVANLIVCATILTDFARFSSAITQVDEAYGKAHLHVY